MKSRALTAIAISALLATGAALAQENPTFDELDKNDDGYISSNEAMALPCLAENFDRIEARSDKGLNESEYAIAVRQYCDRTREEEWPAA